VGTPKASLRKFEAHLIEQDWEQVEEGVEVKLVPSPDGQETFILARSAERREKEKAIHKRFLQRMETGLKKLQAAMESVRLRDETVAHRRLGRLQGENSRAAKAFDVTIERVDAAEPLDSQTDEKSKRSAKKKPRLRISWKRNDAWSEWARLTEGCYLLRSNLNETDPKTLWKHYIQLTEAEWAFRITKDELVLRPIWHHKEDRVKAHILVCFLAYAMWKALAGWMGRSGLGDAPRSLLDEVAKIKSGDVVLPIHQVGGRPPSTLRLRCVTEPDSEQKLFLHRLGLTLPKRLGSRLIRSQM
jgi:transposase